MQLEGKERVTDERSDMRKKKENLRCHDCEIPTNHKGDLQERGWILQQFEYPNLNSLKFTIMSSIERIQNLSKEPKH
jgi:hypothetical protein